MKKIAFIYAHPDDAEIWSGGTILNHCDSGDDVLIIYTHIESEVRKDEASRIKKYIPINVKFANNINELRSILVYFMPSVIVTHWEEDCHIHHRNTCQMIYTLVPKLLIEDSLKFSFYACDTYNSLGINRGNIFAPDVYIDISANWMRKMELIDNHFSQPVALWKDMITRQNRIYGARTYTQYAEGFIRLTTLGYQIGYTKVLE